MSVSTVNTFPVAVQVEFYTGSDEARQIAELIYSLLNDDPAIPGLKIPTFFTCELENGNPSEPQILKEGEKALVVVLADDELAAACKNSANSTHSWGDYVHTLYLKSESNNATKFLPVIMSQNGWLIDPRLDHLNFFTAHVYDNNEAKAKAIAQRVVLLLLQLLRSDSTEDYQTERETCIEPANTIFLSHAKHDMENEPCVVKELLKYLTASHPEKFWFDSGDIASGSVFAKEIEDGVSNSALIAVLTDSYSSRAWCRREILLAKKHQRPVVLVNALANGEVRSFPYIGNVPTIRWRGSSEDVISLINRETLRFEYANSMLLKHARSDDTIFPICPELITLTEVENGRTVLYPDPPLGSDEMSILAKSGIMVNTPIQRFISGNDLSDKKLVVALSSSEATDIRRYGLSHKHQENTMIELSRYLLLAGVRLAYGGDLRKEGYTVRLADMIRDPLMGELRDQGILMKGDEPELINYLPWPIPVSASDDTRLGRHVRLHKFPRPEGITEEMDPLFVDPPTKWFPADTFERCYAWSRGLTEMRKFQTSQIFARLLIGGKIGSVKNPYFGLMPGIFEEFWYSLQSKQPIFLIGSFGGASRVLIDTIEGKPRNESTWEYHKDVPFISELHKYYADKKLDYCKFKDLNEAISGESYSVLNNGLSEDENHRLAHTRSSTEMISLIIEGLSKIQSS